MIYSVVRLGFLIWQISGRQNFKIVGDIFFLHQKGSGGIANRRSPLKGKAIISRGVYIHYVIKLIRINFHNKPPAYLFPFVSESDTFFLFSSVTRYSRKVMSLSWLSGDKLL